jgi:hypothetical protein
MEGLLSIWVVTTCHDPSDEPKRPKSTRRAKTSPCRRRDHRENANSRADDDPGRVFVPWRLRAAISIGSRLTPLQ